MHVLFTINTSWNVWHFRRPVVETLLESGHQVSVLAPPDETVQQLTKLGCSCFSLPMNAKGLNPLDELRLLQTYRRMLQQIQPDIVLSYTIKNNVFGALAAKSLRLPFIPNVSGLGTGFLSGGVLQFIVEQLYRRAFNRMPVVFFQNSDDREEFVERRLVKATQARVLPGSGIDLEHYSSVQLRPNGASIFLMIGRLLRDKGVFEFVEAARQVKAERPDVRFQLLGESGYENRTAISAETVEEWVQEGVVEYLGTTSDVRPAIEAASCVVLPSYREGTPRTLLEASSMARPVIATDVPGCNTVVDNGETGLLCEVRSATSLAEAIRELLALSHQQKAEMGQAGRAKMEREYDQSLVVQAYRKAIQELTDQPL